MKKVIAYFAIATLCLISAGCNSFPKRGSFTIGEIDTREASQIIAQAPVDMCIFKEDTKAEPEQEGKGFIAWAALFEMIAKLKVRVRVLQVSWNNED